MADDQRKEMAAQLARIESHLKQIAHGVSFIRAVVIAVLVIYGVGFILNLLGVLAFLGAPQYIFPAAVLGFFLLVLLFKRRPEP